jgi:hypothetical protein
MRSRLMLGGLAAGLALSFAPQAQAIEPVNCHHSPWLCDLIEDLQPGPVNCHHIQSTCDTIDKLIGDGGR